jgi:hypothetical protein
VRRGCLSIFGHDGIGELFETALKALDLFLKFSNYIKYGEEKA